MDFVDWCECNLLCLNTSKTKEMVIDFRKKALSHSPVNIQGSDIETVDVFKYLDCNWTGPTTQMQCTRKT